MDRGPAHRRCGGVQAGELRPTGRAGLPRTRSVSAARLRGSMQAPQGGRRGFRRGRNLPASARRHDGQTVCLCTFYVVAPSWLLCVLATRRPPLRLRCLCVCLCSPVKRAWGVCMGACLHACSQTLGVHGSMPARVFTNTNLQTPGWMSPNLEQ